MIATVRGIVRRPYLHVQEQDEENSTTVIAPPADAVEPPPGSTLSPEAGANARRLLFDGLSTSFVVPDSCKATRA